MRELHDLFFARHFLRLSILPAIHGFFYCKNRVFKQRFILSKGCQGFNKGCCQYNLIKREIKLQGHLFAGERCTTLDDKVTPLAESSVFDNFPTKCRRFMIIS